jgi:hypothetical protein
MNIKLPSYIPDGLIPALEKRAPDLKYSHLKTVFHCIETYPRCYVGVAGDGDNGGYEWFNFDAVNGALITSDCGFGRASVALLDGLKKHDSE